MATSRTGTATWKRVRDQALKAALDNGQTRCPNCRVHLDWTRSRQPNSPEPDHIRPHSLGGTDTLDNIMVICRRCNQSKGNGTRRRERPKITATELDTTDIW